MNQFLSDKQEVLEHMATVAAHADACGSAALASLLRDEHMVRVERERFHLVVVGEFNHGKTTLVNALVGEPLLPAGVTPTTGVIHRVEYGDPRQAERVARGGRSVPLAFEQLPEFSVGGHASSEDVREIRIQVPAEFLKEGLVLVDTPGVNDLSDHRAEVAYEHLPRADAVIVCLDAGQVLKKSEVDFLKTKVPQVLRDKLWFVINKADVLSEEERTQAVEYVKEQLAEIAPRPRLFPVSAQRSLAGGAEETGIPSLSSALRTAFEEDRGRVLLDNAIGLALDGVSQLVQGARVQRQALQLEQEELRRRLEILEREIAESQVSTHKKVAELLAGLSELKGRVHGELDRFQDGFVEALLSEVKQAKAEELRRYLPGFIEENLRRVAEEQAAKVVIQLEATAEDAIAFVNEENQAHLAQLRELLGPSHADVDLTMNTFAYDVGVFAVGAVGLTVMAVSNVLVGGALALAAPVLAVLFRGRTDRVLKDRVEASIPKAIEEACEKLAGAFAGQIDRFGDSLAAFLSRAQDGVMRNAQEVVLKVVTARDHGDEALQALDDANAAVVADLAVLGETLEARRRALWRE